MLARDPAERPADVDAVLECFWALPELSGDSTSPPVLVKSKRPPRVRPFATRRNVLHKLRLNKTVLKTVSVLLVAVISLAVLGFGLYIRAETQTPAPTVPVDGDVHWAAFDTVKMETQETLSGYCLGRRTEDGSPWQLLEAGPAIPMLDGGTTDDRIEIEPLGSWPSRRHGVTRYGTVSGRTLRRGELSVAFSFWMPTTWTRQRLGSAHGPRAALVRLYLWWYRPRRFLRRYTTKRLPGQRTNTLPIFSTGFGAASVPFVKQKQKPSPWTPA